MRAGRVVSPKSQLPVMQNILLVAENHNSRLSERIWKQPLLCHVGAQVEKEGGICVSARLLTDLNLCLSPRKRFQLVAKDRALHIRATG